SITEVRQVVDRFFETYHLWLPILSRRKLYGAALRQQPRQEDDMNLLIMSMRILAHQKQEGRQRHGRTYSMLKYHLVRLEQVGSLSIALLQSMILLAVYEFEHGIYPAAYLTGWTETCLSGITVTHDGVQWKRNTARGGRSSYSNG
ncbi:hypothetical protein N7462_009770, partial [Penicillium macrosclerotiorum]|uniref:uncharacterized protein n=1 Tax=Penicillium macrosclerotiorum TaxID=303699 RepID=UPI002548E333